MVAVPVGFMGLISQYFSEILMDRVINACGLLYFVPVIIRRYQIRGRDIHTKFHWIFTIRVIWILLVKLNIDDIAMSKDSHYKDKTVSRPHLLGDPILLTRHLSI